MESLNKQMVHESTLQTYCYECYLIVIYLSRFTGCYYLHTFQDHSKNKCNAASTYEFAFNL